MPLLTGLKSKTKRGIRANTKREIRAGKSPKQSYAIALSVAGKSRRGRKSKIKRK